MSKPKAVTMVHVLTGRRQQASPDAFERVWTGQGWALVDDEPAKKPAASKAKQKGGDE